MRVVAVLAALCVVMMVGAAGVQASDACGGNDYGQSGVFDFYVFEQSWPAQFCQAHMDWPGCSNPTAWQAHNLTMHGMWPNYNQAQGSHDWPQCCDSKYGNDIDPNVAQSLLPSFQTYWPNEQDPSGGDLSSSLRAHEWQKHGTCSGLDQRTYFTEAMSIELAMGTPAAITNNIGGAVELNELMQGFGAYNCQNGGDCIVGLTCQRQNGGQYLASVTTCYSPSFQRITCPASTIKNGGCTEQKIYLQSF